MARNVVYTDFYCINCGNKITLPRKKGHQHERGHLKKCYCYSCKHTLNFYEVKDYKDLSYFTEAFNAGEFAKMAKESIEANLAPTGIMEW